MVMSLNYHLFQRAWIYFLPLSRPYIFMGRRGFPVSAFWIFPAITGLCSSPFGQPPSRELYLLHFFFCRLDDRKAPLSLLFTFRRGEMRQDGSPFKHSPRPLRALIVFPLALPTNATRTFPPIFFKNPALSRLPLFFIARPSLTPRCMLNTLPVPR